MTQSQWILGWVFLLLSSVAFSQQTSLRGLDPVYIDFMKAELANSYQAADSTVNEIYRGKTLQPFKVGYLEIPAERLNLETSGANKVLLRDHFYVEGTGKRMVRFFIHPDSEYLYQPLIKEFGFKGSYLALPTSSTRSVLAWDPERPQVKPLFLKLSLAQVQDGLGRVIPGWEVRRSVRLTEQVDADLRAGRVLPSHVNLIPEVAGAYIKADENLGYLVDQEQGKVFEHGYILREAEFIEKYRGKKVVPMFWLFSQEGGGEPPFVRMWKKSPYYTVDEDQQTAEFSRFLENVFFKPFIRMNLPLMLLQGIVPQIHGQNVILVLDPQTLKIEEIYHRDIGSMKADYRLRWIQGLPIKELRSQLADKDFGLSWGADQIEKYHLAYLHDWLLRWGYLKGIRKYIPSFDPDVSRARLEELLSNEVARLLHLKKSKMGTSDQIEGFMGANLPADLLLAAKDSKTSKTMSDIRLRTYLLERETLNQSVDLPQPWAEKLSLPAKTKYLLTDYGVIYSSDYLGKNGKKLKIAFYSDNKDLGKLSYRAKQPVSIRSCQKIFAAGS